MDDTPLVEAYVRWLETHGKSGVHRIAQFVAPDVRVRTPQAEAQGADGAAAIFALLFEGDSGVKIRVVDQARGTAGPVVYLRWDCLVMPQRGEKWTRSGVSELTIGTNGKIVAITDYWDDWPQESGSGFFARLFKRKA